MTFSKCTKGKFPSRKWDSTTNWGEDGDSYATLRMYWRNFYLEIFFVTSTGSNYQLTLVAPIIEAKLSPKLKVFSVWISVTNFLCSFGWIIYP